MSRAAADRYVCAFRGRRDSYQVPLALAEADLLDQFITDFYCLGSFVPLSPLLSEGQRERLNSRRQEGIPEERVRCLWATTALEHVRHALGYSTQSTYAKLDRSYSFATRDRARQTGSNLFLYSPYAWEAFTASYSHQPRRVLFQFHPHVDFENRQLESDRCCHPEIRSDVEKESKPDQSRQEKDCWRHADLIVCASSFTKKTLVEAGANPELCKVIPYGVDLPPLPEPDVARERFDALFVGSGVQRKGLHHLMRAWGAAKLPAGSRLTLICRNIHPGLEEMAAQNDSIHLLRRVSETELSALYRSSSLFVMPSLVEGFGQVYLEALAAGCPVLGTANTCLPDLGGEEDGIFLTTPGEIEELIESLELLAGKLIGNVEIRRRARACAARFSLSRFRNGLLNALRANVSATK